MLYVLGNVILGYGFKDISFILHGLHKFRLQFSIGSYHWKPLTDLFMLSDFMPLILQGQHMRRTCTFVIKNSDLINNFVMDLKIDDESLDLIMEIIKDLHVFGMPWIVTLRIIDDYSDFVYTALLCNF